MLNLYNADCFDVMPTFPDHSFDAIIVDLPYGTTKCKWDSILDLTKLWNEYQRLIKYNGAILMFAQTPFDKVLGSSNLDWLRYEWIWEKTQSTGFLNAKKMPMKSHENILVFYKNLPTYNPQKTQGHKPINSYTKRANIQNKTTVYGKVKNDVSGGGETDRFPRSIIKFASDKQRNKLNGTIHPTQKPLKLLEYLVKTYTNEGDLILDNCSGSGTLGLACQNTNRKSVMIEMDTDFYNIGMKRMEITVPSEIVI